MVDIQSPFFFRHNKVGLGLGKDLKQNESQQQVYFFHYPKIFFVLRVNLSSALD
jgi:hypothetical protein